MCEKEEGSGDERSFVWSDVFDDVDGMCRSTSPRLLMLIVILLRLLI
jgi:hypothetical protein